MEPYINKGDLPLKLDHVEEAKQSFLNAVKYNPKYADAHFNLGSVCLRLKDLANAEMYYKKALAIDPRHHLSLFNLRVLCTSTSMTWTVRRRIYTDPKSRE